MTTIETWLPIKGWEGIYDISSMGRVKRLARTTRNNIPLSEKLMSFGFFDGGYVRVDLIFRPKRKAYLLHRLVALAFLPNHENKPEVNHKDGNKLNNAASNLEWSTEKENMQHAAQTGILDFTKPKRLPVSPADVMSIFVSPLSLATLANKYGIPKLTVQSIKSGKRRSSITGKQYFGVKS